MHRSFWKIVVLTHCYSWFIIFVFQYKLANSDLLHWSPDLAKWNDSVGETYHADVFNELSDSDNDPDCLPIQWATNDSRNKAKNPPIKKGKDSATYLPSWIGICL